MKRFIEGVDCGQSTLFPESLDPKEKFTQANRPLSAMSAGAMHLRQAKFNRLSENPPVVQVQMTTYSTATRA